jgi:hypothetical protein
MGLWPRSGRGAKPWLKPTEPFANTRSSVAATWKVVITLPRAEFVSTHVIDDHVRERWRER